MSTQPATIVQWLWNYCNVLRDDGVFHGDYLEQVTYLLFLKMDAERVSGLGVASAMPQQYNWASLLTLDDAALCRRAAANKQVEGPVRLAPVKRRGPEA